MIIKTLVNNLRSTIIGSGDRDIYRLFNSNLEKFKYIIFYGYGSFDGDDFGIVCGFSDDGSELYTPDHYTIHTSLDDNNQTRLYVESSLAPHILHKRISIPCTEVAPIVIEPVSWDKVYDAPVLCNGDVRTLSDAVFEYMDIEAPWSAGEECEKYLESTDNFRLDVIFMNMYQAHRRSIQKTTLVYHNSVLLGALHESGNAGAPFLSIYAFDTNLLKAFFDEIILNAGLDKYRKKSSIIPINLELDCDSYFSVPDVTKEREDGYDD